MTSETSQTKSRLDFLTNLKLKTKILAGFSSVLIILIAISAYSFIEFVKIGHEVEAYSENVEEAAIISELETQFTKLEVYAREYAVSGEKGLADKAHKVMVDLNKLVASAIKHVVDPADLKRLKEIKHAAEIYEKDFEKSVVLTNEIDDLVHKHLQPDGDKILVDLDKVMKLVSAEGNAEAKSYVHSLIRHTLAARLYSNMALGVSEKSAFDKAEHEFKEMKTALAGLRKVAHSKEEQALHKEMTALLADYKKSFEKAIKDKHIINELVQGEMAQQSEILHRDVNLLRKKLTDQENKIRAETEAEIQTAEMALMIAGILSVIVGIAMSLILGSQLSKPIIGMTHAMTRLAEDDLEAEIPAQNRKDEMGEMAKAVLVFKENAIRNKELEASQEEQNRRAEKEKRDLMNNLADDFTTNVGGIVETVSSASLELNSTAQSMAGIAEETSSQAAAVAAASEEASTNVQTVAAATEEMSNSITEINQQVVEASKVSKQAVEDVSVTTRQINTLAETADKIGDVISLISDIAEQTNLLALNATIESARAGEAGKGFAVVASEVKALANETAKATESISAHIGEIQSATGEAVGSIESIGSVIQKLSETSATIAAAMEEQGAATQEVARNVSEAAKGTQEVSSNISGVTQASQETGNASGQVTAAAEELSKQSEIMKSEIDKFVTQVRSA